MNRGTIVSQDYPVELKPIDISGFAAGNTGIPYCTTLDSSQPGPHVLVNALTHGNEVCGAHAIRFLVDRGLRPVRGKLSYSFANIAAYQSFDEANPTVSRYLDEDLNRVWSDAILDGPRQSRELTRAREMRPLIAAADYLLDIHSMQTKVAPLMLSGVQRKGQDLARKIGVPALIVSDAGHVAGPRMRDYNEFGRDDGAKTALLVECGQHWEKAAADIAIETALRFLLAVGAVDPRWAAPLLPAAQPAPQRTILVTDAITIETDRFRFHQPFIGLEVIERAGTVIAEDDGRPVATPYDECVLIMPSQRLQKGQTAVRLGRFVA